MTDDTTTADHDPAPPRTVAEEAALLVDLLAARGPWATSGEGDTGRGRTSSGGARSGSHEDGVGHEAGGTHECTCGGQAPQACRICPVCQLISFVQKVSPETIERVADVALFAASALRDLAAAQRERAEAGPPSSPPGGDSHAAPSAGAPTRPPTGEGGTS
ncbi:hypothetical protein N865_19515 [Intrasporangium oryzae NRRL B-24470]|uniref:Uncharacterized protein n=1 Tax=Intrasporangium oryzae NRRL B-24470 TaxID=1386089 RepID=W9G1N5_9MICO|nr:hypothetical protein [Intrasporangium oryzae]EWS99985.1 hypothetical protein N865_19515 [Intrasporangium oryzae NRRL B-24470]